MDFRNKSYEVFNMFDKQWALAAAGTLEDFDGCTIGWGSLSDIWGGPNHGRLITTIYVNPMRYTFEYLMKHEYFSVSFFEEKYRKDLTLLGTKSKRDVDKFAMSSLTPEGRGGTVIFQEASLTFICRKIYYAQFEPEHIAHDVGEFYSRRNMPAHYEFIGEIMEVIDKR